MYLAKFEPTLATFLCYSANFHICKRRNIEKVIYSSGHTGRSQHLFIPFRKSNFVFQLEQKLTKWKTLNKIFRYFVKSNFAFLSQKFSFSSNRNFSRKWNWRMNNFISKCKAFVVEIWCGRWIQCDQMARLFVQYLTIYSIENQPISMFRPKYVQNCAKY